MVRESVRHTISDFCERHGFPFVGVFALENTPDGGHGPHTHIQLWLPENEWATLRDKLTKCLVSCTNMSWDDFLLKKAEKESLQQELQKRIWLPVYVNSTENTPDQPLSQKDAFTKLLYLCKSIDPNEMVERRGKRDMLLIHQDVYLQSAGNVRTRRRLGSTRNLGKAARAKAGWVDGDDLIFLCRHEELNKRLAEYKARQAAS